MEWILTVVEALKMAIDLPFLVAFPIYCIAYSLFLWCLAMAVRCFAKAVKALREAFGAKDESSKT